MATEELVLNYPITISGKTVDRLDVRRPTLGDQLAADKMRGSDADKEVALMVSLTGLEPANLSDLDLMDYRRLQQVYEGFLS